MPLDTSIAMGVKPIQIADPLAQYGQLAAIQNAQNQNALAQYTIAKARRDDTATEAMNELYSKNFNPTTGAVNQNALFQELAARNLGSKIPAIQAQLLEQQGKKTTIAKTEADTESSKFKLQQDKLEHGITSMASASTPQAALEKLNDGVKKGYFDQTTADAEAQKIQSLTPDQFQQYRTEKILGIMKATDQLNATAPKPSEIYVGNKKIFIDLNPNSRTFKQEVAPAQTMSATPSEMMTNTVAQANLAVNQGRLKLEQEKAIQPVFNAQAGGFVALPTKENPQGKFTPVTEIQQVKDQQAALKALKSAGYDPTTGKDTISNLIEKSTSGGLQAGSAATLAFLFGKSTEGRKAIASLEGTANQIATDLAGGKLGAGISNTDRDFIVSALGDVSNAMKPAGERLAGWNAAKQRMINTGLIPAPNAAGQGNAVDTSNPLLK